MQRLEVLQLFSLREHLYPPAAGVTAQEASFSQPPSLCSLPHPLAAPCSPLWWELGLSISLNPNTHPSPRVSLSQGSQPLPRWNVSHRQVPLAPRSFLWQPVVTSVMMTKSENRHLQGKKNKKSFNLRISKVQKSRLLFIYFQKFPLGRWAPLRGRGTRDQSLPSSTGSHAWSETWKQLPCCL